MLCHTLHATCTESNSSPLTGSDCLSVGHCVPRTDVGEDSSPYSEFKTMLECEDPTQRLANQDGTIKGVCMQRPDGGDPRFWYAQFTNRLTCEVPSRRERVRWLDDLKTESNVECGMCVAPSDAAPSSFEFRQFKTADACEDVSSREPPVRGACGLSQIGRCVPSTGVPYPSTFSCSNFDDRTKCEIPASRDDTPCVQPTETGVTGGHCANRKGWKWVRGPYEKGNYPDLRVPVGLNGDLITKGPPCTWVASGSTNRMGPAMMRRGNGKKNGGCGLGPPGVWVSSTLACPKIDRGLGPPGVWMSAKGSTEPSGLPGMWMSLLKWDPVNTWIPGPESKDPCPCNWKAKPYHLTKCELSCKRLLRNTHMFCAQRTKGDHCFYLQPAYHHVIASDALYMSIRFMHYATRF